MLPKHLLTAQTSGGKDSKHLLGGQLETPFSRPSPEAARVELPTVGKNPELSVDEFKRGADPLSSPDELSVYMRAS